MGSLLFSFHSFGATVITDSAFQLDLGSVADDGSSVNNGDLQLGVPYMFPSESPLPPVMKFTPENLWGTGDIFDSIRKGEHYSLSLDSTKGTGYRPSNTSYTDLFLQSYGARYNIFSDWKQNELFEFSDCKETCNKNLRNCGWGPLSRKALESKLAKCGMSMGDLTLDPQLISKSGIISCESFILESPADLSSLEQFIGYDCNMYRKDGENDAKFCGCILKKAANPEDKNFSPLSVEERSKIAGMARFDEFQRKTAELQSGLFQVSKILAAALHDPDTKELFKEEGNKARACLPGSFRALGAKFLNVRDDKGRSICGEQGGHRLNEFFKRSVFDCAGSKDCANDWPDIDRAQKRISHEEGGHAHVGVGHPGHRKGKVGPGHMDYDPSIGNGTPVNMFAFLQGQSMKHYRNEYGGAAREYEDAPEQVASDILHQHEELCANKPEGGDELVRFNENCNDKQMQFAFPENALADLESIVSYIDEFRSNDKFKNIDDFVAHLSKDPNHVRAMKRLQESMMEDYKVLKVGVFENHAYKVSPFSKILSLVNDSIPENVNLNSDDPASLMKAASDLSKGFGDVKKRVTQEAMGACKSYLNELAMTCKEMDDKPEDMVRKGSSPFELTNFSPADAATRFQDDKDKLGDTFHPITADALRRKFELYRCGNLMRDPKLGSLAFDGKEGIDLDIYKSVFASVSDPSLKEGLASTEDPTKDEKITNIYADSVEDFSRNIASGGESDLEAFGRAIASGSRSTSFSKDLKNLSDSRLGGQVTAEEVIMADSTSTLNNIADMAKKSLDPNGSSSSSTNFNNFDSESNYAKGLNKFNKESLEEEERQVKNEKSASDERLDVITDRIAKLLENQKKNDEAKKKKEKELDSESLAQDSAYQQMLIDKLKLEKEIASLGIEKKRKLKAKQEYEEKLTAIENEKENKAKQAQEKAAKAVASSSSKTKASANAGGGSSGASRKIASVGSGGGSSASGGSGGGFSADSEIGPETAPYVITLTQDQVTAIKQKFQVVENPSNWVAGGKPPVIREGNIFYELQVEDGKIIVPYRKKALNGFNVAGLRVPASDKEPLPMKVDKDDVQRRRAARVKELNALLDSK